MPEVQIAKLESVNIRDAWAHEALNFTPWLHENLDALGEAIGISLEQEATEVAVERFAADILARNQLDGTAVLIENQLDVSDHNHLGQILTYLAGLDAKTIIWVAADFREAHLSAVSWLNEHTDESISFFAVRIKVVRIADSPFAPVFDVVGRPNNWERQLQIFVRDSGKSETSQQRFDFWVAYVERIPGERERFGGPSYLGHRWHELPDLQCVISLYCAQGSVGLYIRPTSGGSHSDLRDRLLSKELELGSVLGVPISNSDKYFFGDQLKGDYKDPAQRDLLIDWLGKRSSEYERALQQVFG